MLAGVAARIRRQSLRARLTGVLLLLAAVGLIVLAAITWGSQAHFLEQQLDDRVRAAARFVPGQVFEKSRYAQLDGQGTSPFGNDTDLDGDGRGPGGPPPGGSRRGDLPPGTYGEIRTQSGERLGLAYALPSLDGSTLPAPKLPASIPMGRPFTVHATRGDTEYRVYATRGPTLPSSTGAPISTVTVAAIPLDSNWDQLTNLLIVDAIVILVILGLLGVLASRLVGGELAPLRHIADDADRIAGGQLDRRVPETEPGTEVGRLAHALNAMLGRIEEAFAERQASEERLRRFLSDASHELRTPLASIRGYAELQRTGMLAGEEERAQAVARIEEQAARMGTLVEDLLALARLDEEREQKVELVELASIARDAVADASAMDPGRTVECVVDAEPLVLGDESRLRQVLANLLSNAVAHTPAGSAITARVLVDGGQAVLWVDDAGDGVPAEKRELIFDRFHREAGGTARTRGPAGAGLGLAVVRGIVQAHGGTVVVEDAPTGGARFTVRLPLADTSDE